MTQQEAEAHLPDKEVVIGQPLVHVGVVPSPGGREWVTQLERTVPGSSGAGSQSTHITTELRRQHLDAQARLTLLKCTSIYLPSPVKVGGFFTIFCALQGRSLTNARCVAKPSARAPT